MNISSFRTGFFVSLLLVSTGFDGYGQFAKSRSSKGRAEDSDFLIHFALNRVINSIRDQRPELAAFAFAKHATVPKGFVKPAHVGNELHNLEFQISSLKIEESNANVLCELMMGSGGEPIFDNVTFARFGPKWQITSSEILLPIWEALKSRWPKQKYGGVTSPLESGVNVVYSTKLLLPVNVFGTSQTKVTRQDVVNGLGISLFREPIDIELGWHDSIPPGNHVSFFLDRAWDRVVIAKGLNRWIASYGDNPGDHTIHQPAEMAVSPEYDIYVAVPRKSEIVKLKYDHTNESITLSQVKQFADLSPTGIVYDKGWVPDLEEDVIWVADESRGKILS